ncbi:MAG: hypothetical protein WDN49_03460, partial [Acetobacteraceae bacterium]
MAAARPDLQAAKATLRTYLEGLFGAKLRGVSGFGAGLDYDTHMPALNVMTTTKAAASRAKSNLPAEIDGLPVKITQRSPAIFE